MRYFFWLCVLGSLMPHNSAAQEEMPFAIETVCGTAQGVVQPLPASDGEWRIVSVDWSEVLDERGRMGWRVGEVALIGTTALSRDPILNSALLKSVEDSGGKKVWYARLPDRWVRALNAEYLVLCARRSQPEFLLSLVSLRRGLAWCQLAPYGGFHDRRHKLTTYSPDATDPDLMACFRSKP